MKMPRPLLLYDNTLTHIITHRVYFLSISSHSFLSLSLWPFRTRRKTDRVRIIFQLILNYLHCIFRYVYAQRFESSAYYMYKNISKTTYLTVKSPPLKNTDEASEDRYSLLSTSFFECVNECVCVCVCRHTEILPSSLTSSAARVRLVY